MADGSGTEHSRQRPRSAAVDRVRLRLGVAGRRAHVRVSGEEPAGDRGGMKVEDLPHTHKTANAAAVFPPYEMRIRRPLTERFTRKGEIPRRVRTESGRYISGRNWIDACGRTR